MNILEIEGLNKSFGSHSVIRNLSFTVPEHKVFGFIGQNGAGKTTTMKMILGLLKADSGQIKICGETAAYGKSRTNRFIGYLPDVPEYYNFMSPVEYLNLCGDITGMDQTILKSRRKELIEMVGLKEAAKKRIGGFSRGMKQRLGIAQALLNEPQLLICDEPTSALDPLGRKEILEILEAARERTTVLFSTHILSDVERICDHVALLNEGTIALSGTLEDLRGRYAADSIKVEFYTSGDLTEFRRILTEKKGVRLEIPDSRTILIHTPHIKEMQAEVLGILHQNSLLPVLVERQEPSLESLFLEVVQ